MYVWYIAADSMHCALELVLHLNSFRWKSLATIVKM